MKKKLHKIVITPDGWIYVKLNNGKEIPLGDIGIDVIIKTNTREEQLKEDEEISAKDIISYELEGEMSAKEFYKKFKKLFK